MAFAQFEDETGVTEAIFFPKAWDRVQKSVVEGTALCIEGKLSRKESRGDASLLEAKILVDSCTHLSDAKAPTRPRVADRLFVVVPADGDRSLLQSIKKTLEGHPGTLPVSLLLPSLEGEQEMKVTQRISLADALLSRLSTLVGPENVRVG
jgi:DNA polymerase III alpha subunit